MNDTVFLDAVARNAADGDAPAYAVVAARLDGHGWADIAARIPGATSTSLKQAHEGEYLIAAGYTRVHRLIDDIALAMSWSRTTAETVQALIADSQVSEDVDGRVGRLGEIYVRVLNGERVTDLEASAASDEAVFLVATFYLALVNLTEDVTVTGR